MASSPITKSLFFSRLTSLTTHKLMGLAGAVNGWQIRRKVPLPRAALFAGPCGQLRGQNIKPHNISLHPHEAVPLHKSERSQSHKIYQKAFPAVALLLLFCKDCVFSLFLLIPFFLLKANRNHSYLLALDYHLFIIISMCIILPDLFIRHQNRIVIPSNFSYRIFIFKLETNCDNIAGKKQIV